MANKYKNIVGTAFAPYVKNQFDQRRKVHKKNPRTSKELLYLTNRNSFFRLSSAAETTSAPIPTPKTASTVDPSTQIFVGGIGASQTLSNNVTAQQETDKANAEQLKRFNDSFTGNIAKDNVLQGGTVIAGSKNSTTLRKGFKQTYAEGTLDNLGLKPMPGITGITIGTGGKWQTLMQADIEFICYDLDQLDTMSKLYMSLGVTCFLEWGHTPYLDKSGNLVNTPTNLDFFGEKNKLNLIKSITKKRKETDGNYDAFLGTVYNFSYQADKDGAYLCKTQLMGAGGMLESLKINTSFNIDFAETKLDEDGKAVNFNSSLDNVLFSMSELLKGKGGENAIYKSKKAAQGESTYIMGTYGVFGKVGKDNLFKLITDKNDSKLIKGETRNEKWGELLNDIYSASTYTPFTFKKDSENSKSGKVEYNNEEAKYGNAHQYITGLDDTGLSEIDVDFYAGYTNKYISGGANFWNWSGDIDETIVTYITFGHLLALINSVGIFTESNKPEANKKDIFPVLYIDYHPDNTIINLAPITATINPFIALVPFVDNIPYNCFFAPLNVDGDKMSWHKPPDDKGLKSHNLSKPDVKNRINTVLPPETFIYDKDNLKGGKLMNVLVNIDFARDCLRTTVDSDNNVNLIEYISKLLDGINKSLGGVNNFRPFVDECGMILRFIDEKAPNFEAIKDDLVEIPTFGLESSAYDASYQSAITPKLASQIVIATQAAGGQGIKDFSEDVLSYQSLNANVKDRFATYKFPAITKPTSEADLAAAEAKYVKSLLKLYNTIWGIYTPSENPVLDSSTVTNMLSPWIDLSNIKSKQTCIRNKSQKKNNSSILIPLEYTITMDGIAGILPYNAFLIPDNRLPERYRGRVSFAVFSINHAFDNNNWTTTLRGQTLMLDTPKTIVDPTSTAADEKTKENPNNENPNQSVNFPKKTNTGTETSDKPNLTDSPNAGRDVTDSTSYNEGQTPVFGNDLTLNSNDIELTVPFTAFNENDKLVLDKLDLIKPYDDIDFTTGTGTKLRIGFGSETVTRRGQVRNVVRGDIITKEEAYADLKRLLSTVTKPYVVDKLRGAGVDYYKLDKKMQVVILDIAYNYEGNHKTLYNTFVSAIKKGKQALIDELIRRRDIGPSQVPTRRQKEINYLRG